MRIDVALEYRENSVRSTAREDGHRAASGEASPGR
jgi:hypothetical protein